MKKLFFTTIIACGLSIYTNAQAIISNETMISNEKTVTVSFDVDTDAGGVSSQRKEVIMPFLYNGTDTLWLDEMMVYGKGRYKRERQVYHINGDKDWELSGRQMLKGKNYLYSDTLPLKLWMTSANLGIRRHIIGCGTCNADMKDQILAENQELLKIPELPARRTPNYLLLAEVDRAWDFGQDELEVIFKVSKAEIDSTVFNNEVTFSKILTAIDKIHTNPKYKIEKIQVAGYASPEGHTMFNAWLGENRAKALINYIIEHRPEYNLTMKDFEIVNGEENWAGLRRVLSESEMKRKDEVIAIIDDERISNARKKNRIKALDNGEVWRSMLKEIYPHLRCARYLSIYYDSTEDHAVEIINTANMMIRDGKYQEALDLIKPVENDMRAYNTIGVALMMQLKFEEAMPWFEKAIEGNCPSAQRNIDAINAEYRYESEQKALLEEFMKQYE